MSRLVALYSVFCVQKLIRHSILSVGHFVDEVRVYDGRYTDFVCPWHPSAPHDNSCDDTFKELIRVSEEISAKLTVVKLPTMNEMAKRSLMFDDLENNEVGLVIDDDEMFYGNPNDIFLFMSRDRLEYMTAKAANLEELFIRHSFNANTRVFRKTPGLHYESYYQILDDEGVVADIHKIYTGEMQLPTLKGCGIVSLFGSGIVGSPGYREQARDAARWNYDELMQKRGWK